MSTVTKPKSKTRATRSQAIELRKAGDAARISREVAKMDFDRRAIELRRQNKTYAEIAIIMSEERGEVIPTSRVRQHVLNRLRDIDAEHDVRMAELDKLESMAAKVRERIDEMEALPEGYFDVEVYTKIVETYLKYRDRIARLMGLDQGGNNGGKAVLAKQNEAAAAAAAAAGGQHLHVHVGSVDAFEEWQRLHEAGVAQLAHDVIELQSNDLADQAMVGAHNDAAGTVLAPHVDARVDADRRALPASSLDALNMIKNLDA